MPAPRKGIIEMEIIGYRDIVMRDRNGKLFVYRMPTVKMPDDFYDKAYADWLKEHNPAEYVEYMRIVEEAFVATL